MKATKILLSLAVMGTLTLGFAATDVAVDAQITAIQNAPASERVTLMNEFKTQLSNMNAEDRSAAIAQMQTKMQEQMQNHGEAGDMDHGQMQTKMQEQMQNRSESGEMGREQMQEHASEMQMEHSDEMNRAQNMNQQQAGSQFEHGIENSGGSMNRENVSFEGTKGMFGERH